jgi:hypothetical protein
MAEDVASDINYYLAIDETNKADLAQIRQWSKLKVGLEESILWVKDFDYAQINSVEVKSIPFKTLYYSKGSKLYLLNSQLPDRPLPSVLWTPIERALPVRLPSFNHNYFGIHEKINIQLVSSDVEAEPVAMILPIEILSTYITIAPAVRLEKIRWTILDGDNAFLLGKPLLPLPGDTYWQRKDLLLPTGFDLELSILSDVIQKRINPGRDCWAIWNADASYALVPKENVHPLSLMSFRLSSKRFSKDTSE